MNVHLHIDRLVIDGIDIADQQALTTALQAELARLLTEQGVAAPLENGGAWASLPPATLALTGNPTSAQIGRDIAQAIFGGIGRE